MDFNNLEKLRISVGALMIILWIAVPLYLQSQHGISAVKVSFGITVIYYLVFGILKRRNREQS